MNESETHEMVESILHDLNEHAKDRPFLNVQDIMHYLSCDEEIVYNWTKRVDPKRRPFRIIVGKEIRFPKKAFARWLIEEQGRI